MCIRDSDKILNPHTACEIYDECNEKLKQPEYSARGMMRRYHVEVVCTTAVSYTHLDVYKRQSPLTADVAAPSQMQGLNAIVLETHIAILIIDRRCSVSYTHLDVYKRQGYLPRFCPHPEKGEGQSCHDGRDNTSR